MTEPVAAALDYDPKGGLERAGRLCRLRHQPGVAHEGEKSARSVVVKLQIRPDPLAK